ncbi:MAG: HutD family protein [Pseudomonadota bacterium]
MIDYLPAAERLAKPWKNGGGSTADVLAEPPGASLEHFDWRVSLASIEGSGPFSEFKGVDRSLHLISEAPLRLLVDEVCFQLDRQNPSLRFSGEARVRAETGGQAHTVLNVMCRRHSFAHAVSLHAFSGSQQLELSPATTILFVQSGACRLAGQDIVLQQYDALRVQDETAILLQATAPTRLLAIAITLASL